MNSAGIDVSKGKSMVAIYRPFNETVAKPFAVRHTGSELKQLADYLKSLDGETRVVMEHTGRYYEQIAQYLHEAGLYVSAANPKLIKDYGAGNTLRHVKTDKADAKKIVKSGTCLVSPIGVLLHRLLVLIPGLISPETTNPKASVPPRAARQNYVKLCSW